MKAVWKGSRWCDQRMGRGCKQYRQSGDEKLPASKQPDRVSRGRSGLVGIAWSSQVKSGLVGTGLWRSGGVRLAGKNGIKGWSVLGQAVDSLRAQQESESMFRFKVDQIDQESDGGRKQRCLREVWGRRCAQ